MPPPGLRCVASYEAISPGLLARELLPLLLEAVPLLVGEGAEGLVEDLLQHLLHGGVHGGLAAPAVLFVLRLQAIFSMSSLSRDRRSFSALTFFSTTSISVMRCAT